MKTGSDWHTPEQLQAVGYFATKFGILDAMIGAITPALAGLLRSTFDIVAGDRLPFGSKLRIFSELMERRVPEQQRERLRTFVTSLRRLAEFRNDVLHSGLARVAAEGDAEARLLTLIGRRPGVISIEDCHARGDECEHLLAELFDFVVPIITADPTPLR